MLMVKIIAAVVFALSLVVNGLAGSTNLINGYNTADISDLHPTLFTPAGLTFAIWGVIYLLVTVYVVRQFFPSKGRDKKKVDTLISSMAKPFILLSLLNTAWLFAWQYDIIWLSLILMLGILGTLIHISSKQAKVKLSGIDWLTIRVPFSIYFGWITVATIANVAIFLTTIGWDGWGIDDTTWTVIILIIGAAIGVVTSLLRKDWAYLAVLVWAYIGILVRHTTEAGFNGTYSAIVATLIPLIIILAVVTIYGLTRWPKGKQL